MDCSCEYSKENLLRKISEIQFVCVELNLYIDTHPEDEVAKEDYACYASELNELINRYEEIYDPLLGFGLSVPDSGCWVRSAWPWE
ncbi:MAG: spore coat protein CotJB [Clostridiales bacterium]|nr:spore coat protein CotJB [Clostridiales bacterium]